MLLYRQEFNLVTFPESVILLPILFHQPQLVISVAGSLSPGRDSNYTGKIQQQIISSEVYFKIRGDSLTLEFGYQLFMPRFGSSYQLEFLPSNRLINVEISVYELEEML